VPPAASRAPAARADAPGGKAAGRVTVLYPRGACVTGWLEVEVFERGAGSWRPHPLHPWLRSGSCAEEDPGVLLNELRVRCADPDGAFTPSRWRVGAELRERVAAGACPGAGETAAQGDAARSGGAAR
jgi:hypothetical protein